jgi:hypothetical protein
MDEHTEHEAQAMIQQATARKGLITVLTRHLEQSDDLLAMLAAAEIRNDPHWLAFTKGIVWYHRKKRKIARKRR